VHALIVLWILVLTTAVHGTVVLSHMIVLHSVEVDIVNRLAVHGMGIDHLLMSTVVFVVEGQ
jgi:hypothetical protein